MRKKISVIVFFLVIGVIRVETLWAEERLSWTWNLDWNTKDLEFKRSVFTPYNLPKGQEANRILPWVFHDDGDTKLMELRCLMTGYNPSDNPSDYKNARWSHSGFDDSQIDTTTPPEIGDDYGNPYAIWTIKINTTASDAGKKWVACEFQQGDLPHRTEFVFLIFKRLADQNVRHLQNAVGYGHAYGLGGEFLDEKDINYDIEMDIKRQISKHYFMPASDVTRSEDGQIFTIFIGYSSTTSTYPTTSSTTKTSTSTRTTHEHLNNQTTVHINYSNNSTSTPDTTTPDPRIVNCHGKWDWKWKCNPISPSSTTSPTTYSTTNTSTSTRTTIHDLNNQTTVDFNNNSNSTTTPDPRIISNGHNNHFLQEQHIQNNTVKIDKVL